MALPNLPIEVWRRIIAFTVRLSGASANDIEDPFAPPYSTEESPEPDPSMSSDRKTALAVCSTWRTIASEIIVEYLKIYSDQDLLAAVEMLEKSKKTLGGNGLGEWTRRIDFHINKPPYNTKNMIRLFQCTPNLAIYVNKNGNDHIPERKTPSEVIQALVTHCGNSLRRVEWACPGESPSWKDLLRLCRGVPNLQTLRLFCIFSYAGLDPYDSAESALLTLPFLKTLSLGLIPGPTDLVPHLPLFWDPLLTSLSHSPSQLPSFTRLELDIFPSSCSPFFTTHGSKIRFLRTNSFSFSEPTSTFSSALPLCSNLDTLVLSHGSECDVLNFPLPHPSLRRICIVPFVEELVRVPPRIFANAVLGPLDTLLMMIETMRLPNLVELRIKNSGAFIDLVDHPLWLQVWWRRWNIRGVRFEDKLGRSFDTVAYDEDLLLDSVRG